jgi:RNA polymerase sigma factor (sigma-70 family)
MTNDDRRNGGWNDVAPTGDRKLLREPKVSAHRLVGTSGELTATELMNELQASGGTNDKVLSDLQVRLGGVVMNQLRRAGVRHDVIEEVCAGVWRRVWKTSCKPAGTKGAWNPARARHTTDPFIPWLKRVARSRGIDWHRHNGRLRKQRQKLKDFIEHHGAAWLDERGDWEDEKQPGRGPKRRKKPSTAEPAVEKRAKGVPVATRRQAAAGLDRVATTVAALDERQRRVLELCAEGLTNVQIAAAVGCSKGEVSRRLTAARKAAIEKLVGAA